MKDIDFNVSYGDLSFSDGDLDMLRRDPEVVLQKVVQVLKTAFGDYKHSPYYGANIEEYIGESVSTLLADEIQKNVLTALNAEGVMPPLGKMNLPYVIKRHTILYRLIVPSFPTLRLNFERDKGLTIEQHP